MRLLVFVRAQPVCGTQKNSKWSFPSTWASRSASTASTRIGSSTTCRAKAGTTCRVTVDTMPSAPSPTRAPRNTSGSSSAEQLTIEPSAVDQPQPDDLVGQAREAGAGAVGGGRRGAGDRLVGDVTQVRHRQPSAVELEVELLEGDAGLDGHPVAVGVERQHPCVAVERHQPARGEGDVGEAVTRADDLDRVAVDGGLLDQRARDLPRSPGGRWRRAVPAGCAPNSATRRSHPSHAAWAERRGRNRAVGLEACSTSPTSRSATAHSAPSTASASPSAGGSSSASSVPTARGRPRPCAPSSASSASTGAPSPGTAARSPRRFAIGWGTCRPSAASTRRCGCATTSCTSPDCRGCRATRGRGRGRSVARAVGLVRPAPQPRCRTCRAATSSGCSWHWPWPTTPSSWCLDEPFSGLDPLAVDVLKDVLLERVHRGAALLFSSHQLDLIEDISRDVVDHRPGPRRAGR